MVEPKVFNTLQSQEISVERTEEKAIYIDIKRRPFWVKKSPNKTFNYVQFFKFKIRSLFCKL